MKRVLMLLVIVLPVVALLYFGLTRDPRELPCALVGKRAPDFTLAQMDGGTVTLAVARGAPVVLNFWSTWCGTCAAEHALIQRAQASFTAQGVRWYSILYGDTVDHAKAFMARYGPAAPVLLDPNLRMAIDYGVAGVPETFFIDRDGIVRYKHAGPLTPEVLVEQLDRLTNLTDVPQ